MLSIKFRKYVSLTLLIAILHIEPLLASTTIRWKINSWGSEAPSVVLLDNDLSCNSKNGSHSTSFVIHSRGNGDAELTLPDTLIPNAAYSFSVWLSSAKETRIKVFFRRDDFPYESTAIRQINVSDRTLVNLKGIHASNGIGSVRIALADINNTLCINSPNLVAINLNEVGTNAGLGKPRHNNSATLNEVDVDQALGKSHVVESTFFGVHINRLGVHNNWPLFQPGILRLWDTGTTWALLQPTSEPILWNKNVYAKRLDLYIQHGKNHNPKQQYIYTLGMTPAWAGSLHKNECNHSSYGPSVCTKPVNLDDWRNHVKELGNRYKGVIKVWEIWNEADHWFNWSASPEEMVSMAEIAYFELKKIDYNNQVIGPNITTIGLDFLNQFLSAGGGDFIDGVSIHAYIGRSPELSLAVIRNLQQLLKDQGYEDKKIWNTETNVSCNPTLEKCDNIRAGTKLVVSGENALAQAMLGNAALGVENFTYYTWEGASAKDGGLPLVEKNYLTPTVAGKVYANVKSWINGAKLTYLVSKTKGLNLVKIERDGQQAYAAWSFHGDSKIDKNRLTKVEKLMFAGGKVRNLQTSTIIIGEEPVLLFPHTFNLTLY